MWLRYITTTSAKTEDEFELGVEPEADCEPEANRVLRISPEGWGVRFVCHSRVLRIFIGIWGARSICWSRLLRATGVVWVICMVWARESHAEAIGVVHAIAVAAYALAAAATVAAAGPDRHYRKMRFTHVRFRPAESRVK